MYIQYYCGRSSKGGYINSGGMVKPVIMLGSGKTLTCSYAVEQGSS